VIMVFSEAWAILKDMIPVRGKGPKCPSCGGKLVSRGGGILQCEDCGYNYSKEELE